MYARGLTEHPQKTYLATSMKSVHAFSHNTANRQRNQQIGMKNNICL